MAQIEANGMIDLDADQVIRSTVTVLDDGTVAQKILASGGALVPEQYDQIDLTYVTVGNGIGEIETVVYSYLASVVATLTLSYDGSDRLSSVVRS